MAFRQEPPRSTEETTAVVLVNLGTPDAPETAAVRRYLRQFLSDPRVVEIPRAVWWFILNGIILPFRSSRSAAKYRTVWTGQGSPLMVHTRQQAVALGESLARRGHRVTVVHAMRYGNPALPDVLDRLKVQGCQRILIIPAYPQYSGTTTASIFDAVFAHYRKVRDIPALRLVRDYRRHPGYIQALQQSVLAYWAEHGRGEKLVMSFHGVPKRTHELGDPYYDECLQSAQLLADALELDADQYLVTFQSRFGRAEWLQPYTAPTVQQLGRDGVRRIDVICPGFTSDCLETLEEIAMEVRDEFLHAGGTHFHYIACLNESAPWLTALADIAEQELAGWPTRQAGLLE